MKPSHDTRRAVRRSVVAIVPIVATLLAIGIVPRLRANERLQAVMAMQALPVVQTIHPGVAPATQDLVLPGSVAPFAEASIYARTSGYLAHWNADIGAHVSRGQTLATIEAPDLNDQLRQARADQATAQANYDFAKTTAQRWQQMLKTQAVAQQDADTKVSDSEARRAMLASAQANVARLAEL